MPIVMNTRQIPINFIIFCRCEIVVAFRIEGNRERKRERESFENIKRETVAVLPYNFGVC